MHENINETLKTIVQKPLEPVKIVDLISEDANGNPSLRIRVVYKSDNNRLDQRKAAGLIGH
ncbi:MAG: hypothetical protein F4073_05775 [Rhodobacteraceae bacterium]|nr:hypothetical protein [Paracoccaceae bacterium]MYF45040.1 hypothetical protein [Paracoccaceae bacterium]MYI91446.1 hypothetical protein [Paracoccaceae bacterium]